MDRATDRGITRAVRFGAATIVMTLAFAACASNTPRPLSPVPGLVRIPSCVRGDTLLGPVEADRRGIVRSIYDAKEDVTYLTAGGGRHAVIAMAGYHGRGPFASPDPNVTVILEKSEARPYIDADSAPSVTVQLDDSTTLGPYPGTKGTYHGPRAAVALPVSFHLAWDAYLRTIRANRIVLTYAGRAHALTDQNRHDLRALERVAICTEPDSARTTSAPAASPPHPGRGSAQ